MAHTTHCLSCFRHFEAPGRCPGCGTTDRPGDRRTYWNHHPHLQRLERVLKALIVVAALGVGALVLFLPPTQSGTGGGFALAMPAAAAWALWETAGGLTRHNHSFRPGVLWPVAALLGGPILLLAIWSMNDRPDALSPALILPASLMLAFFLRRLCQRCAAWKSDLMAGRTSPPDAAPGSPLPRHADS